MASDTVNSFIPQELATVSSLYGPGTVTCWYFTVASVLVSWTLHPHKRNSGSIDVDLIATLTLPSVAAGHVISQSHSTNGSIRELMGGQDLRSKSAIAAIEAPFIIVETFMALSVILFLIAAWMANIRRALCVAVVGLLCFVVECYIHFSHIESLRMLYYLDFERTEFFVVPDFVVHLIGFITGISIMLSLFVRCSAIIVGVFLIFILKKSSPSCWDIGITGQTEGISTATISPGPRITSLQTVNTQEDVSNDTRRIWLRMLQGIEKDLLRTHGNQKRVLTSITMISCLFLPISFFATVLPLAMNSAHVFYFCMGEPFLAALGAFAMVYIRNFSPQSNISILDLDQAIAATTGATVLAFSIYGVTKAKYKSFGANEETES